MKTPKKELPWKVSVAIACALAVLIYTFAVGADDGKISSPDAQSPATNLSKDQKSPGGSETNAVLSEMSTNETEEIIAKIPPDFSALGLRPELEEIVKLAQSGVSEDVIIQYINQSTNSYTNLTASEIITLNDLGVPSAIISAMMRKAGKSEQEIQKITEEKMVVSVTNETITATREPAMTPSQTETPQTIQPTNQVQVAQIQTQVYTQTVYVPVQTQQPQVVVQQQPVVLQEPMPQTVVVYYNYLSPYGSWLYIDGYGYCWQPTIAVINPWWRPYYHGGRWIWTDYGWYWLSDYSWGWATFHYGRWHYHHRCGWVWVPDTVWGPAWVSWRITPTYCGWAPLPPRAYYHAGIGFVYHGRHVGVHFDFGLTDWHYTFVSWHHFHRRDFYREVLPRDRARPIYENSTVINNYIVGNNNNVVINTGVGTEHISRLTREEVKKVVVRDAPTQGVRPLYSERLVKDGNNVVLYRPSPQTPLIAKDTATPVKAPVATPLKYTVSEKPSAPGPKIAAPVAAENKILSESAKPKGTITPPLIQRPDEFTKRMTPADKMSPVVPGGRQPIEPIKPAQDMVKTPAPAAPMKPSLTKSPDIPIKNDGEKIAVPNRTPEIARAEVPKNITTTTVQPLQQREIPAKPILNSNSGGNKTTPILPNHGLTAETYGSARQNPIITPSVSSGNATQFRTRSPSGSASGISQQPVLRNDLESRMRQESLPVKPPINLENRVQTLPSPSPVIRETPSREIRTPAPAPAPLQPRQPAGSVQPITPSRPINNPSETITQPGGIKFTPLPTPSTPTQPPAPPYSAQPRMVSPPQTTVSTIPPSHGGIRYEAPKPSISPSPSPSFQAPSRTPSISAPRSVTPVMPSAPPSGSPSMSGSRSRTGETK